MNQDDILRMAREVGLLAGADLTSDRNRLFTAGLERFAALVAAAEREVCLQIADYCADADMHASMAANAIRARSAQ